jgi:hypothetical protein
VVLSRTFRNDGRCKGRIVTPPHAILGREAISAISVPHQLRYRGISHIWVMAPALLRVVALAAAKLFAKHLSSQQPCAVYKDPSYNLLN